MDVIMRKWKESYKQSSESDKILLVQTEDSVQSN